VRARARALTRLSAIDPVSALCQVRDMILGRPGSEISLILSSPQVPCLPVPQVHSRLTPWRSAQGRRESAVTTCSVTAYSVTCERRAAAP
jgi:hypothetical protein